MTALRRSQKLHASRNFTFLEMLVVTLIVTMLLAVAAPKLIRSPKRLATEQMLTTIRQAFLETAARARATGNSSTLTLQAPENNGGTLLAASCPEDPLDREWTPPLPASTEAAEPLLPANAQYDLPPQLEWQNLQEFSEENPCRFRFFPNGEAAGPALQFSFLEQQYQLQVDGLTGTPLLTELP